MNVSSFRITSSFSTVTLLLFSLLFVYVSHHICLVLAATPPHYPILPISLNSLDLTGVRLLSPRLIDYFKQLQVPMIIVQVTQLSSSWSSIRSCSLCCFFYKRSVVMPSWGDRGHCRIWGCSLFLFRSRTLIVSG